MAQSIYEEPAVIKRTERRGVLHEIASNGTIAAAVMVGAALLALVVANGPAFEAVEEFLREPLVRRFGEEWYDELVEVAKSLGL